MLDDFVKIVQAVGFPIAVAAYFLWKDYKTSQQQIEYAKVAAENTTSQLETSKDMLKITERLEENVQGTVEGLAKQYEQGVEIIKNQQTIMERTKR